LVRPPEAFVEAAADWVCVRITNMRHIDLDTIRFDFDLTLSLVLMNAEGTVYHRYGSRPFEDPLSWTSIPSLLRLMEVTLEEHAAYQKAPSPPPEAPARTVAELSGWRTVIGRKEPDCIHCHTVHDIMYASAQKDGTWTPDQTWIYPEPSRIGVDLDVLEQELVTAVADGSPAAAAGLRPGDRLQRLGIQPRVRTIADVQWALHHAAGEATTVPLTFFREGERREAELALEDGWKRTTPREYAWRAYKWNLSPAPGFGGPALARAEKEQLGLDPDAFAFRVQYLVDWGRKAHRGRAARRAGIRKGDVIASFAGKADFDSIEHFHAWVRLTRRVGERVEVELLRDGERRTVELILPR